MSKVTVDTITSGYNLSKINANFVLLQDELNNKVLYRTNPAGEPNSMSNDIDMNSNDVLNANIVDAVAVKIGGISVIPTGTLSVTAVSVSSTAVGNVVATDVQAAIEELDGQDTTIQDNLDAHITDSADAHNASAISVEDTGGFLTATDVEGALEELADAVELGTTTLTHNMTSDTDYTLSADENKDGRIVVTDTGVLLTLGRNIIVATVQRSFFVLNSTAQTLTFKTSTGTGIAVAVGDTAQLVCDGTNIVNTRAADTPFQSSEQVIATTLSIAHSLGVVPSNTQVVLRCIVTDLGYAIDDELDFTSISLNTGGNTPATVWCNSTNIGIATSSTDWETYTKTGGASTALTNTSWRVILRAWE